MAKPITKTALSTFVHEHTSLNLTQSKALTDQLLAQYSVTVKQPVDLGHFPIDVGQEWLHQGTQRTLRVTDVESGPQRVPNDPVTSWGPVNVSWQETADPASTGTTPVALWLMHMAPPPSLLHESEVLT